MAHKLREQEVLFGAPEPKAKPAEPTLRPEAEYFHPGGKLLYTGSENCTDEELLAILIGFGMRGRTAKQIADDILMDWYSINGLLNKWNKETVTEKDLLAYKGMDRQKAGRVLAGLEIARRICIASGFKGRTLDIRKDDRPDEEVLAHLFHDLHTNLTDARDLARRFLAKYGDFLGMTGKPFQQMMRLKGLGQVKVARIGAVCDIAVRMVQRESFNT